MPDRKKCLRKGELRKFTAFSLFCKGGAAPAGTGGEKRWFAQPPQRRPNRTDRCDLWVLTEINIGLPAGRLDWSSGRVGQMYGKRLEIV